MANSIEQLKGTVSAKMGFAAPNLYRVFLPSFAKLGSREVDVLCTSVNMPGRQIMTIDKKIGTIFEKIAYDQAYDDINLSFYVLNDYGIRNYFEAWQNLAIDQETYTVGYKSDYAHNIRIQQLRKMPYQGERDPKLNVDFDLGITSAGLGIDVDITLRQENVIHEIELIDAFPTTMDLLQLGNDLNDQVLQLNVQLSYKNWRNNNGSIIKGDNANNNLKSAIMSTITRKLF